MKPLLPTDPDAEEVVRIMRKKERPTSKEFALLEAFFKPSPETEKMTPAERSQALLDLLAELDRVFGPVPIDPDNKSQIGKGNQSSAFAMWNRPPVVPLRKPQS